MTDNVYSTICPGCNFGCGLYIRENGALEVDFRKSSPANAGKLCRFGMNLPKLFAPIKIDGRWQGNYYRRGSKRSCKKDFSKQGFSCILIIGKYYI